MRPKNVTRALAVVTAALALAACATIPIPHEVDLRAEMEETTGTVSAPVRVGEVEELDMRFPTDTGECFDFAEVAPGATVHSAQLHWNVAATYEGPDLTGKLQARAYVAGAGDEVFHPSHTLGPVFTISLDRTKTRQAGSAVLNPTQLQAINDREVCWGVEVKGDDIAALEDGEAEVHYEIDDLRLRITFGVI